VLFVIVTSLVLIQRLSTMRVRLRMNDSLLAVILNFASIGVGVAALVAPTAAAYEWLLALLISRPGVAFLLALGDISER